MPEYPHPREFVRSTVRLEVEVVAGDSRILVARTRDVSMKGIFLRTPHRLPVGTSCRVRIRIGDPGDNLWVECDGAVVRTDADGFAIEFHEMGVASFQHLRNVVMYNADDPARVEGELDGHVGLKRP
jgi:PilZ domain-containing protein